MKLIIAGSRYLRFHYPHVGGEFEVIDRILTDITTLHFPNITEVVSGGARGADEFGERWAFKNNIPIKRFPVTPKDWQTIGRSAGHLRNERMALYAATPDPADGGLLALWDMQSSGTRGMIQKAKARNLKVAIAMFKDNRYAGYEIVERAGETL